MVESAPPGASNTVWSKHSFRILGLTALSLVATATVAYHYLGEWSWVDSLYFSVVAGTTVGFGDLAATTDASELFTVGYLIGAVSIIGTFLSVRLRMHSLVHVDIERNRSDPE